MAEGESADAWWARQESKWRRNPGYYENLRSKAERYGKEWVREQKPLLDRYWNYAQISQAWSDAPLPQGYEKHARWLLERLTRTRECGEACIGDGYARSTLDFLAGEGELMTNAQFERALAAGQPIPYGPPETAE